MKAAVPESDEAPVSRQMIEAISWKLIAEFHRRHPDYGLVFEGHPGGGQYDCLGLWSQGQALAYLNRAGGFAVMQTDYQIGWHELWPRCLTQNGLGQVLDEMSRGCGLSIPEKVAPTAANTLSYRVMAMVIAAMSHELNVWEWRNGIDDTSGYPCQDLRDGWFCALCMDEQLEAAIREGETNMGGRYKYWFLLKDGTPLICIKADVGLAYWLGLESLNMTKKYSQKRSIPELAGCILSRIQP